MIYRNAQLNSLLRNSYNEKNKTAKNLVIISVFLGVITVAVHSLLETVSESVLSETMPQLMLPSYYTIAYKYNLIAYVFVFAYFFIRYDTVTFTQINKNKWYMLIKMGYGQSKLLLMKTITATASVACAYSLGFVITMTVSLLFKYSFIFGYLLTLFVAGLTEVLMIMWFALFLSLFIRNRGYAAAFMVTFSALLYVLKYITGYSKLIQDRLKMTYIENLFNPRETTYMYALLVLLILCVITTSIIAYRRSHYFSNSTSRVTRTQLSYKTGKLIYHKNNSAKKVIQIITKCVNAVFISVIVLFIIANMFVLYISLSSSSKEFTILGYMPYIVQSDTMQPFIYKNDLVLFKKVDTLSPLQTGDVALFTQGTTVCIEQIVSQENGVIVCDITNYPSYINEAVMEKTIYREDIYGILSSTNRGLGAFILFANTFFGRLLLFIVPVIVIFFNKPIGEKLMKLMSNPDDYSKTWDENYYDSNYDDKPNNKSKNIEKHPRQ